MLDVTQKQTPKKQAGTGVTGQVRVLVLRALTFSVGGAPTPVPSPCSTVQGWLLASLTAEEPMMWKNRAGEEVTELSQGVP